MSKYCQQNFDGNDFNNKPACSTNPEPHIDRIHQDIYGTAIEKHFHGLDLGIIRIGTEGNSLDLGVNVGIARVGIKVGQETGVHVGAGIEGLASASAGVGAAIDNNGLHGGTGGGVDALHAVAGHARFGADVGTSTGAHGDVGAHVGPAHAGVRAMAGVGEDGLNAGAGGRVGIGRAVDAHAGGQLSLSRDSQVSVGAGGNVGPYDAGTTGGVFTDGNRYLRPGVDGYAVNRDAAPAYYGAPPRYGQAAPEAAPTAYEPSRGVADRGSIEVTPLPAPKESLDTVERKAKQQVLEQSTVIAQKGETYLDILVKANPDRAREDLASEVPFIKQINHNRPIRAGAHIATLSHDEVNWKTKVLVAQRMGWAPPQG